MKILLIDKNLVDPVNHKKWNLLASKEGVTIKAITPSQWVENFQVVTFSAGRQTTFPIVPLSVHWQGKENRAFYLRGLGHEMRSFEPDIILCFEEPFSLFALQTMALHQLCARQSKLVFYTWDNLAKGRHFGYRPAFLYAMIQKIVIKHADLLLTANEEGKVYFEHAYSIPVRKLYFGIDLKADAVRNGAAPSTLDSFRSGCLLVGYVGRLLEMKGVDTLVRAIALLDNRVRLVILGSGPDGDRLRNLSKELKLDEKVIFLSAVRSSEARAIMKNLDVLVLPSRTTKKWKEQYGRVLIESMALGVSVIGSDSGAIPEIVGDSGLIFHEGDVGSLANAIERVMSDSAFRSDLSKKGFLRSQEFSPEKFADMLHSVLTNLCH